LLVGVAARRGSCAGLPDFHFNWNDLVFSVGVDAGLTELTQESSSIAWRSSRRPHPWALAYFAGNLAEADVESGQTWAHSPQKANAPATHLACARRFGTNRTLANA
jgi:hypothetical protein